jgi:hypothetical protein
MRPHHFSFLPIIGSILIASPGLVSAAVTTVSPWHTAGNGSSTDYGIGWFQVPNLALYHRTTSAFGSGAFTGQMSIWALGFSDLHGISYAPSGLANLSILPVSGWTGGVSFFGFDLGVYDGATTPRTINYQVWNGDFSSMMTSGSRTVGATHATIDFSLYSSNGFHLQFDGEPGYIGLDDYRVEGGASAIPEPSSILLFALSGVFFVRRRA